MSILKNQVEEFDKVMTEAINKGLGTYDEEMNEKFYTSRFTLTFYDKTSGSCPRIDLDICPEVWELIEKLVSDIPEVVEEYDD